MRRTVFGAALAAVVAASAFFCRRAPGEIVMMAEPYQPGTIVVKTNERHLYLVVAPGEAIRYPVGVGRAGMQWSGTSIIDAKYVRAGLGTAAGYPPRKSAPAAAHFGRLAAQSDGRRGDDARWHRLRHPRHQRSRARSATSFRTAASACSMQT